METEKYMMEYHRKSGIYKKGEHKMKLFNSNKVKGKVVLEALVDGRTQALLKTLEMEKLDCEVKYKVLDSDTIALYISIENPIDMEIEDC